VSNLVRAEKLPKAAAEKAPKKEGELRHIVRLLGSFTKGQNRPFIMGFVMLIAEMVTALADGLPLALAVDYLIDPVKNPDVPTLVRNWTGLTIPPIASPLVITIGVLAVAVVVIAMLNSLTDSLAEIYLAKAGRLLGYNMRIGLYTHLQKLSLAFYNKQRTGDLLSRVTSDVSAIEEFITKSLSDIVGGILTLIGTMLVLFYLSWQVALVACCLVPVMAYVSDYFSQRVKEAAKKARSREGDLASSAQEMLTSIRVIQTYGSGSNQLEKFSKQNHKTMESSLEAAGIQARFSFTFKVMEAAILAGIICLGVFLNVQGLIALGTLVFLIKKIDDMFKPTKKIIKEWNTVGKIYASVERIGEILDRTPAVTDAPNAVPAPAFKGHVEFKDVSFAYMPEPEDIKPGATPPAPRLALRAVSFDIKPGEVAALVGTSGAGKSTIVQLLPRLYDPHAGMITIDGFDTRSFTLDSLRSRMSMVLQEAILFTGTVAENIAYGRTNATREEVIAAAMQASAHEFIQQMPDGYDTVLSERAGNLSGGQRQRIAIARAFIRNTPILILDEPTTGLDAESTELVQLALRELMKGKATIIISHDLNLIRQADKIIAITQGQIAQIGTHKELLREGGLYADLYNKQFGQAVEDQGGSMKPVDVPAPVEVDEDDDGVPSVTPRAFQTLIGKALPAPVTPKAFQTLMMQMVPLPAQPAAKPTPVPQPATPQAAQPTPVPQAVKPMPLPAQPAAKPAPAPQPAAPTPPPAPQAAQPARAPEPTPQAVKPMPLPPAPEPAPKPKPAIFETTVMHTVPQPQQQNQAGAPAAPQSVPQSRPAPTTDSLPPPQATLGHTGLRGERLDLLNSAVLQSELPALKAAFDTAIMAEQIQTVLFGKARPHYNVERCAVDQATYLPGEGVAIRYEVLVKDRRSQATLEPLVVAMLFQNQLACALYMRDKLAPLVELTRGRADLAPFATPAAMIEPLNMVLHVFPIDGELPALVPATDSARMRELFNETLPAALDNSLEVEKCDVELVDYARRYRAVLRYRVEGRRPGSNRVEQQIVYGKVFTSNIGALAGPVTAALRERVLNGDRDQRFNVPRSLGWRPDMQLSLLEAIPGKPLISDLLKARLRGHATEPEILSLRQMIDACARIAAQMHSSDIQLGRRRTLDDELAMLRKNFVDMRRLSPDLGAQMESWLDQLNIYAEQSDALRLGFCHGDYTYTQVIFEGQQAGLVDFDSICQAEPALDLGHFLAYLRVAGYKAQKLASGAPNTLVEELSERFLTNYLGAIGDRIEDVERLRVRVAIYQMISLLRRALRSWQKFKGSRLENALALIEEEMACLPQLDY
jgi:ABC-type multidrug transport system fused ATPase/permease subunit/thiamine kinase-like enzyme